MMDDPEIHVPPSRKRNFWSKTIMARNEPKPDLTAHTPGTPKGEERRQRQGPEPGREDPKVGRTARDAIGINARARKPIDPRLPEMPPS
jgi:hypothetical protein